MEYEVGSYVVWTTIGGETTVKIKKIKKVEVRRIELYKITTTQDKKIMGAVGTFREANEEEKKIADLKQVFGLK